MLWHADNGIIRVTVHADATTDIVDCTNATVWHMGPVARQEEGPVDIGHVWLRNERSFCEQYSARFRGEQLDDQTIRYSLISEPGTIQGALTVQYQLDGPWLEVRIVDVAENLPSLVFPTPIVSESLVIPQNVGRWIREPLAASYAWVYPVHLNMRWFGGLHGDKGWMAVQHEGFESAGALANGLRIAPLWLKSLGTWSGTRTVRYRLTEGGYVGLAKAYRAYAREQGLLRSLAEKAAADPRVNDLKGGRLATIWQADTTHSRNHEDLLEPVPEAAGDGLNVYFTHQQAAAILPELRAAGMQSGLVVLRGWINGGYDERHPDVWPPEPALGTIEELRAVLQGQERFHVALHDNYLDIYPQSPSFPQGIIQDRAGRLMRGGFWAGGQAYILNIRSALGYLQRNWQHLQTLTPQAMFPDTVTAMQFFESYEDGNVLTRAHDYACKLDILRFYKSRNLLLGSEEGTDFGIPYVDWYENRHRHRPGVSIPLWGLVFHDAAVCYRYPTAAEDGTWLPEMLWGYGKLWHLASPADWHAQRPGFSRGGEVDRWHAQIGFDELLYHQYVAPNVERTTFTNGAITVNFNTSPVLVTEREIPAQGFVIES